MPLPIICANAALCQFADAFAKHLSKPQRKYFVDCTPFTGQSFKQVQFDSIARLLQ